MTFRSVDARRSNCHHIHSSGMKILHFVQHMRRISFESFGITLYSGLTFLLQFKHIFIAILNGTCFFVRSWDHVRFGEGVLFAKQDKNEKFP